MATRPQTQKSAPMASLVTAAVLSIIPASAAGILVGSIAIGGAPNMLDRFVHPNFWPAFAAAFVVTEIIGLVVGYRMDVGRKK
ncbi:hypothetical protein HN371_08100 [Candidatus Poribacteria bacterium]|jgi:hypothetical protein|nr:hypothetical protein [Candidatus Poribacteria bacterium]MBT5534732.1 hypothetical protein [Candidatus Poribacteria bacterium]MBT5712971.1 hypothetical protein [Candidatus Poribacteria bacterium]MBT7100960.1 hypothetical protein [Candidatus Poribacteria bacterium]MBT7809019.1 hypothetical protein [Candidatus Poribacteria bacterium]